MKRKSFLMQLVLIVAVVSAACTSKNPPPSSLEDVPLGELTELFRIEETDDFYLAMPFLAIADESGRFYLSDAGPATIYAFAPDGNLIESIGQRGSGPGEFQTFGRHSIDKNGNLHVHDNGQRRVSVFRKTPNGHAFETSFLVKNPTAEYSMQIEHFKDQLYLLNASSFAMGGNVELPHDNLYLVDNSEATPENPVLQVQRMEVATLEYQGSPMVFMRPFGNRTIATPDKNGNVLVVWTGEAKVSRYNLEGELIQSFGLDIPPQPVTDENRQTIQNRNRPGLMNHIPEYRAVVNDMFLAVNEDIWLNIDAGERSQWLVFSSDGTPKARFVTPEGFRITHADSKRAYGVDFSNAQVVVYEMTTLQ